MGSRKVYEGYSQSKLEGVESRFAKIPRWWVKKGLWADLPKAGKAVLPVLLYHRHNRTSDIYPSLERLSQLSGRSRNVVLAGIEDLRKHWGLTIDRQLVRNRTCAYQTINHYRFNDELFNSGRGGSWPMPALSIEGRGWGSLTPSAQAIYIVFGTMSKGMDYTPGKDIEFEDGGFRESERYEYKEFFGSVALSHREIASYAGISTANIKRHIGDLIDWGFIEENGIGNWILLQSVKILKESYASQIVNRCVSNTDNAIP